MRLDRTAFINLHFDGHPSDWLERPFSQKWHTLAFLAIPDFPKFEDMVKLLIDNMPVQNFKKWSSGGRRSSRKSYQKNFIQAVCQFWSQDSAWLNIVSFQENELRNHYRMLLDNWCGQGRAIDFGWYVDEYGKHRGKHEFVNFHGFFVIDLLETQLLMLSLMGWCIRDQYMFYEREAIKHGFEEFIMAVVSDRLSGDDEFHTPAETALKNVVIHQMTDLQIQIQSQEKNSCQEADYLVDNFAGFFNSLLSGSNETWQQYREEFEALLSRISWVHLSFSKQQINLNRIDLDFLAAQYKL